MLCQYDAWAFGPLSFWVHLCYTQLDLQLSGVLSSILNDTLSVKNSKTKIPLGSGSIEASPIIRYKDAMKACVSTMYVQERAFMAQITCKFAPSQPPSLKMVPKWCMMFYVKGR